MLILTAQLLQTTHSSFWVGCGLFLTQGPVVLLAPFSGVLADRFDRRTLNVVSSALSAIVTAALAALTWLDALSLPLMLGLSFVYGISFVFQLTLRSTLVPSLVAAKDLLSGVSLFQVATQGAQFVGPAIAAPVLVRGGPSAAWVLCTILYAASAALSLPVGAMRAVLTSDQRVNRLSATLTYLRIRPLAWTAIWAVSLHCAMTMAYPGMLPMFVTADLRGGDAEYGALLAAIGLGAVIGSIALATVSGPVVRSSLFAVSLVGSGISLSVMGAAQSFPVAVASGFVVGGTQAMFMSMALALIQGSVEDQFRGRATSLYQMITGAPMAVFGWGMGGLADITEPRPLLVLSGIGFVVLIAVCAMMSTSLRRLLGANAWRGAESAVPSTAVS